MKFLLIFVFITSVSSLFIKPIQPEQEQISVGGRTSEELKEIKKLLEKLNEKSTKEIAATNRRRAQRIDEILENHDFGPNKENQSNTLLAANSRILDYMYQGDIMMGPDQIKALLDEKSSNRRGKRTAIQTSAILWDAPILYAFDSNITKSMRVLVREAMDFWQNNTCVSFIENVAGPQLLIAGLNGCYSWIGRNLTQRPQILSLGNGCEQDYIAIHELGHALGSHHTQTRYDRDDFVTVLLQNVNQSHVHNFVKLVVKDNNNLGIPYDYGSVMHYASDAFALDRSKLSLIAADLGYQKTMGAGFTSYTDLLAINRLYKCETKCSQYKTECENNGYMNPNDCTKCVCPPMFSGRTCTERHPGTLPGTNNCGSTIDVSSTPLILNGNYTKLDDDSRPMACYYHLRAPKGKRVELQIITSGYDGNCASQCLFAGLQIFNNGTTNTPMTFCCPKEAKDRIFLSMNEMLFLRAWTRKDPFFFQVQHRYV